MAQEQQNKTGFFVFVENSPHFEQGKKQRIQHYQKILTPYFQKVEFLGAHHLFWSNNKPAKGSLIFKCHKYNGLKPNSIEKY